MSPQRSSWPALALLFAILPACARKDADLTPDGAVRELLDHIDRTEADPAEAHAVYELLSSRTKSNLIERARRASTTSGREVAPEEMLAPGRFSLRFEPRKMHVRVADDRAVVDVVGIDPDNDRAEVPCVLEEGRWRVEIPLPALTPMERRPDTG
jgi:hypothetical protein